jgi:hypothetical protein
MRPRRTRGRARWRAGLASGGLSCVLTCRGSPSSAFRRPSPDRNVLHGGWIRAGLLRGLGDGFVNVQRRSREQTGPHLLHVPPPRCRRARANPGCADPTSRDPRHVIRRRRPAGVASGSEILPAGRSPIAHRRVKGSPAAKLPDT